MPENNEVLLTVFTPAYNRAHTLPRTYESLRAQEDKRFKWLIVDDGSTDGTQELVRSWQSRDNGFEIRCVYKDNGGMHTAHNTAYALMDTELNVCIDSDDALAPGAAGLILSTWERVRNRGYAGLLGLDADFEGRVIGSGFPKGMEDTTLGGYYGAGGRGDKKLALRTDVVRRYPPYPTFEGEKFVPLGTLYTMIDRDYRLGVVDAALCSVEYMADGSTKNMLRQYARNPRGFRYARLVSLSAPTGIARRFVLYVHYAAESYLAGEPLLRDAPDKALCALAAPAGLALMLYIRYKNRDAKKD